MRNGVDQAQRPPVSGFSPITVAAQTGYNKQMNLAAEWNQWGEALPTRWLGRPRHFFAEIDSTNRYLQARAAELPAGTLALTDFQSIGRGRLNRRWVTPPGRAILMSILLKPDWPIERLPWLTMIAGLAAAYGVKAGAGLDVGLKWPNDLVFVAGDGAAWHKVAGILVEKGSDGWVVGLGINVNQTADELPPAEVPPTSVRLCVGHEVDRQAIIRPLLTRFEALYDDAQRGRSPLAAWREALVVLGQAVEIKPVGERPVWAGTAVDVDESGRLLVRTEDGTMQALMAGDVSLRPSS